MWVYYQLTGEMVHNSPAYRFKGYAGKGEGKNNPDMQDVKMIGPLPCGWYDIERPASHPKLGAYVMFLTPDPANDMMGRSEFAIHGDSRQHPGDASNGCIILGPEARMRIWQSNDHRLKVMVKPVVLTEVHNVVAAETT